jgi:hypothetical protein
MDFTNPDEVAGAIHAQLEDLEPEARAQAIAAVILSGEADADLERISNALKERWDFQARKAKAALAVGDRVRFTSQARRFAGREATVTKKLPKNIVVSLDDGGGNVRANATLLELVE